MGRSVTSAMVGRLVADAEPALADHGLRPEWRGDASADMGAYAASQPLDEPPGEVQEHSSGSTSVLCDVLQERTGLAREVGGHGDRRVLRGAADHGSMTVAASATSAGARKLLGVGVRGGS